MRNLARGVVERVFYVNRDGGLAAPPKPLSNVFGRLTNLRNRLLKTLRRTPIVDRADYSALYTGRKRGIYERAFASLQMRAINVKDSWVSTFVKAEKVNFSAKGDPAPRVIQPRSPRFNLEVGRYLKLFEGELCRGFKRLFGYSVIVKGMNASEVGETMNSHWNRYSQPVAVGLDASRFDQHVSYDALQFEHSVYNSVFRSKELAKLLQWQLHNTGIGRTEGYSMKYSVKGCRMSGDINTGMGNCLLMSMITIAYCESAGIDFRLANNGDDCVLILDRRQMHMLQGLDSWFTDFGFTLTREAPVYRLEQVVFCQMQPVLTGTGWRMTRDPRTAMSKDCVSLLGWSNEEEIREWAGAVGACGMSLSRGVPLWEAWYRRLQDMGKDASRGAEERIWNTGLGYMARGVVGCPVTAESRVSFYYAFGITPDMQVASELEYSRPCSFAPLRPMTYPHVKAIDNETNPLSQWLSAK